MRADSRVLSVAGYLACRPILSCTNDEFYMKFQFDACWGLLEDCLMIHRTKHSIETFQIMPERQNRPLLELGIGIATDDIHPTQRQNKRENLHSTGWMDQYVLTTASLGTQLTYMYVANLLLINQVLGLGLG